jgi:hypothetical protein
MKIGFIEKAYQEYHTGKGKKALEYINHHKTPFCFLCIFFLFFVILIGGYSQTDEQIRQEVEETNKSLPHVFNYVYRFDNVSYTNKTMQLKITLLPLKKSTMPATILYNMLPYFFAESVLDGIYDEKNSNITLEEQLQIMGEIHKREIISQYNKNRIAEIKRVGINYHYVCFDSENEYLYDFTIKPDEL